MVKLKQVLINYIELIHDNNTDNKLPLCFKGYADMNHHLLSEHNHQIILDQIQARVILTMMNMWSMKITTMQIVMILMMMIINNSHFVFNLI